MDLPAARTWLLDRKIIANRVGLGLVPGTRAFLDSLTGAELAPILIGGLTTSDLPGRLPRRLRRPGPGIPGPA